MGTPISAALLVPHSAPTYTTRPAALPAATVENDLHRVVAAEGPPQRFIEIRPLAPDDEEELPDRLGHAYIRLDLIDGNQRVSGESSHRIVSSRWAPVEMRQKRVPINSSRRSR
jgi:hypothetical protein